MRRVAGVPRQCVYDNLKTAVLRILAGPERQEHTLFSSLRAHYLFDSLFCNPNAGNEKGSVENGVGYVRRNALVPVGEFADWGALNAHLQRWCEVDRERRGEAWAREATALRPLPVRPFRCAVSRLVPVSRLSLVRFDHNRYSVPCRHVGEVLGLDAFTDRVELWHKEQQVAVHHRYHGRGETIFDLDHYLPALADKPRAVAHVAVVRRLLAVYATARELLCRRHPSLSLLSSAMEVAVSVARRLVCSPTATTLSVDDGGRVVGCTRGVAGVRGGAQPLGVSGETPDGLC